jgi:ABC-type nitrate/sulfonate/bicarbonate transport system substrate-binding protein
MVLKIGYVPEHFSAPLFFAQSRGFFAKRGLKVELIPFPSGSGHLIQSLDENSLDVAVGLTEAFVRGIAQGKESYKLIGTYVKSPLRWAVSTGIESDLHDKNELRGKKIGVSRIGSGSYVMAYVLAMQLGFPKPYYEDFPVLSNFKNLRDSVNKKEGIEASDAFMWEYFTTKRYYDNKEVRYIGDIYTPWPSWVINARTELVENKKDELVQFLKAVEEGISYFNDNKDEAVEYIYNNLDYSKEDAQQWIKTVHFQELSKVGCIDHETVIENTYRILIEAGVLEDPLEVITSRLDNGIALL